nr:NACHT and WD repeat domain-containing protein 2-like [Danio rerio]|eukprot:XP_017207540.1 NACHT and WD repeat domain-containing protein 2-like [Danio rerio]
MACVQVYLCSNPEDSVVERTLIRQKVFPRLREYCRSTYGLDFRVIDPYEATKPKNWPTQQERLRILEDCWNNSLHSFFVGLVGEQYGDACLPEQVEASEFQLILQVCQRMGFKTDVLEKCYRRDENTIPPSFCMLEPSRRCKQTSVQQENPTEEKNWCKVFPEVRRILHDVVNQCIQEGTLALEKAQKYFQSWK